MVVGDFSLSGKVAVVTGGGSGINLAYVRLALQASAKVLIADLKLLPEAEQVVKESHGQCAFAECDVSNWSDLNRLPSEVANAFNGAVADVWIAGAGVFEPQWSSFLYDREEDHYKAMQINAEHPIKLTRIAMRSALGANKPAVVLIVASGAGITGQYGAALYCATKHAVVGFTKSMGQADIDENIKIVCILPGMVATPLWKGADAKDVAKQYSYTDDMCITAEDVAEGMKVMVESSRWKGGSLMEIRKGELRNELESQVAVVVKDEGMKEWERRCFEPVREVFRKERGAAVNGANGHA